MPLLRSLITATKDGEWGKADPFPGSVSMRAIRGTDFKAVREGRIEGVPHRFIAAKAAERKRLKAGDLIIEVAGGTNDQPTGRTLFITDRLLGQSAEPMICASFSRFIRLDTDQVEPGYLFWALQQMYNSRLLFRYHTQHTGVARFQWTVCADTLDVPLPDRLTQRKISELLFSYDALIENNNRRIQILEGMAQAIYREWFVEYRFPGHQSVAMVESELGPLPEGWICRQLGEAFQTVLGGTPSRKRPEFWASGTVPWINSGRVNDLRVIEPSELITEEALRKSATKLMPRGTTLIAITGATLGQVSVLEMEACANQSVVGVVDPSGRYTELLYLAISDKIESIVAHASGGAQQHINKDIVNQVRVALPPGDLADEFQTVIDPTFRLVASLLRTNANLRATRDLLLPRLISGELDVSGLDIDVGDAAA